LKGRFQTGFPLYTGIYSSGVSKNYFLIFLIFKFIWNGKPDKVKRNTLIGDFAKSGLKMIDIESYFIFLNASCRLTDSKFSNWKLITKIFQCIWEKMAYFLYEHTL
jgi:hypothetical protein